MLRSSFQARIASVLTLLLLVVVGSLYIAVQAATGVAVRAQASEQLQVGTQVFEQLLDLRGRQLHDAVQVLAADFGFKDAVASGDAATIQSAMANHGARINASVVMMLDLDGNLMLSTDSRLDEFTAASLGAQTLQRQNEGVQTFLMPLADKVYLLVQSVIAAPLPIARVMMGFEVDERFARELHELTHLELTLVARQKGLPEVWISTLPVSSHDALRQDLGARDQEGLMQLGQAHYLGQHLLLASGPDFEVQALLHRSLAKAEQAFVPLERHILLIALAALVASLVGALLLARSISQPVRQLAEGAARVGQGNYQVSLELARGDELGQLSRALQTMQQGIAEREQQLAHNALHDALTGLPNRSLALERLGSAITARRPAALLYLGIGNFRSVNENCGPGGGDLALQQLSRRLQVILRPGDSLARIIGDEFLLLLENTDSDSAVAIADRVQQMLIKPLRVGTLDIALDCRIGIAAYPDDGDLPEDLLRRASIAMQDAAQLPGRLQIYQRGRDDDQQRQVRLIRDLRRAADNGELLLHYQPKLDIAAGHIGQAEALLRWQHPHLGMVSPRSSTASGQPCSWAAFRAS